MQEDFEKNITDVLTGMAAVNPSKDIGEAAIERSMKKKETGAGMKNKISKGILAMSVCVFVMAFGGVMVFSEDARNNVSSMVQSIFTLEKQGTSYEVVQKDAAAEMDWWNLGGIPAEQFGKEELTDRLGFEPFAPEKTSSYSKIHASVGVHLLGPASELNALDRNEVLQSIKDDTSFRSLEKYEASRFFTTLFSTGGKMTDDAKMILHMSKAANKDEGKTIEKIGEFSYKGVECTYIDDIRPDYQRTQEGGWTYDDNTKPPKGIIRLKHIAFDIDGVHYSASYMKGLDLDKFDDKEVKQFVEEYIDAYRNK